MPAIDQLWLLCCSGLVLLMQAGFLCLEAGLTRSKNAVNVAFKNVADLTIAPLLFWLVGAAWMFGVPAIAWTADADRGLIVPLVFQSLFCATAATIVSGAVAERMRLSAYAVVAAVLCLGVYPWVGQWVWGSAYGGPAGWLEARGYQDFAGSSVVHMVGGFAALGAITVLGPRTGRFALGRRRAGFPKSSLPLAMLGALLLLVGWIGFNGGSTGEFNANVGVAVLNTLLCGMAGGASTFVIAALDTHFRKTRCLSPEVVINGMLGGLVASCAAANTMQPAEAVLIGVAAALVVWLADRALVWLRIDDVIGAFPVHGAGGVVGVLSAALVANSETTLPVQAVGAIAIGAASFAAIYVPLRLLAPMRWLRVTKEEEQRGLNEVEHGVKSEFQVLSQAMDTLTTDARPGPIASDPPAPAEADEFDTSDDAGAFAQQLATLLEQPQEPVTEHDDVAPGLPIDDPVSVLDGIDLQVAVLDDEGRIIEANQAWRVFARSVEDDLAFEIGATYAATPTGSPNADEALQRGLAEVLCDTEREFRGELTLATSAGERDLAVVVKRQTTLTGGVAIVTQHDVTDQRNHERRLRDGREKAETLADALETSQRALELAVNGGNLGLWHWDVNTGYFELSRGWLAALGHENTDLGADVASFRDLLHPDDRVLWTEADARSLAVDEPYDRHFRLQRADGSYVWTQALGRANRRRSDGAPESLSGIVLDIDARKNADLRDVGMAKIIEDSLNEVFVVDAESWRFIEVNRGARENLGLSLAELTQMTPADIKPDYSEAELNELVRPLLSGETERLEFETRHQRRDGSTYPVMINLQKSELVGRQVFVAIAIDLTQRRALETQLAQAQKLESIGQLAAGVAHEMNTPLQYVGANIKYLTECGEQLFEVIDHYDDCLDRDQPPQPWSERVAEIRQMKEQRRYSRIRAEFPSAFEESLEGVGRVLSIVRAMKEFSHPGDHEKQPTDLNNALSSMATVTRNRWKDAAELELDLDPNLPTVECNPGEMNQVFVNLIVNAADAVASDVADAKSDKGRIVVRTRRDGDDVVIIVEDDGCGMPADVQRRVFDPFFTTKEVGKGTGQGLSLSHTIVAGHHNGSLTVASTPGIGTTFEIRLPHGSTTPIIPQPEPATAG